MFYFIWHDFSYTKIHCNCIQLSGKTFLVYIDVFVCKYCTLLRKCSWCSYASNFVLKFEFFKNLNHYRLSFYLLLICIGINSSTYFGLTALSQEEFDVFKNHSAKLSLLTYCVRTSFGLTKAFRICMLVVFMMDSLVMEVIEIFANIVSIAYFRQHIKNNLRILAFRIMNKEIAQESTTNNNSFD